MGWMGEYIGICIPIYSTFKVLCLTVEVHRVLTSGLPRRVWPNNI